MENSFYSPEELAALGLAACGTDVLISRKASLYSPEKIRIGSHVRVDDFCVLSGSITLKDHIHLAVGVSLFAGDAGIELQDGSALSARTTVYAISDDYSGDWFTNPMLPEEGRHLIAKKVTVGRHAIVGAGSVVLPGADIGEGCAVGSMSLVKRPLEPWGIYAGVPAKLLKPRSRKLLERKLPED